MWLIAWRFGLWGSFTPRWLSDIPPPPKELDRLKRQGTERGVSDVLPLVVWIKAPEDVVILSNPLKPLKPLKLFMHRAKQNAHIAQEF